MASYSVADDELGVRDKSLSADTMDTVTFERSCEYLEVVNVSGTAAIWFTFDGTNATVAGAKCYRVPAAAGASRTVRTNSGGADTVVKLISSGTPSYDVSGNLGDT
jgi:hypothetical protein